MLWGQKLSWESSVITVKREWKEWLRVALSEEKGRFKTAQQALQSLQGSPQKTSSSVSSISLQKPTSTVAEPKPTLVKEKPKTQPVDFQPQTKAPPKKRRPQQSPSPLSDLEVNAEALAQQLHRYKMGSLFFFCIWGLFSLAPFFYFNHLENEVRAGRTEQARKVIPIVEKWWIVLGFAPWLFSCCLGVPLTFLNAFV